MGSIAAIALMVERPPCKRRVSSSSLDCGSIFLLYSHTFSSVWAGSDILICMKTISISCGFCQKVIERSEYEVTRSTKLGRSLYCSLSCGAKHAAQKRNQKAQNIEDYNANPKKCKCCDTALSYEKKYNDFCGHSCAATFNNPSRKVIRVGEVPVIIPIEKRRVKARTTRHCDYCGNEMVNVKEGKKFCCFDCSANYRRKIKFDQIEAGNNNLYVRNYRNYLIYKRGEKCESCGWDKVNPVTGNCPIELEHIDGNSENNSLDNLKLLCPNCHSLTPTYKNLNKGKGRHSRRKRYAEGKSYWLLSETEDTYFCSFYGPLV